MHIHLFCQLANLIPYAIGLVCGAVVMYLAMQSPTTGRNAMFAGFGKYIREGISALAAAVVGFLVTQLAGIGIDVPVEQSVALIAFVTLVVYSFVAKFLKRFPWLDIEGFLELQQAKRNVVNFRTSRGRMGDRL